MATAKLPTTQPALADFFGQIPGIPNTTATLSGAHTDAVTTITLTGAPPSTAPTAGAVTIDNEIIHYTGKGASSLTGCTRGQQDTTAAAHTDGTTVRWGISKEIINQLIVELIQMSKTGSGAKGADVASAAALNIGEDGHYFHVTGTTAITSIETRLAGQVIALEFDGTLTLTHNATSLILRGAANVTTAAGDVFTFVSEGSGNWREIGRCTTSSIGNAAACRVYHDAAQSIANATNTALAFNQERFDNDTMHDTATNNTRITFTTAGKYIVGFTGEFTSNATGARGIDLRLNGTTTIAKDEGTGATRGRYTISTLYDFAANDYVEVMAFQSSGGALDMTSQGNWSPEFWATKVG